MIRQKTALLIGVFLLLIPMAAMADSIDPLHISLNFDGGGMAWSWAGAAGSTLTFTATGITTIQNVESASGVGLVNPLVTVTSGPAIGGSGTALDPFTFGPGGSFTVTSASCGGTCFRGNFVGGLDAAVETGVNSTSTTALVFSSHSLDGTFDQSVYAMLGEPSGTTLSTTGNLTSDLAFNTTPSFAAGGSGHVAGGTMVQTLTSPTPEPASLLIFGTGLLALGFLVRRRLVA